ncbi:MAG: hypothetical protein V4820_04765 [Pseudomonadota bacterium]|uniref:hypothetical protein n=1 Tax=Phenylobacterium sp. TaxID=1871053 RepID=UPI0027170BE9|nr:hypothetical protein [Phenylobacterium sp.]MDO9429925.1 hypothetical protein [Phenylobacterium sp.]
MPRNDRWTVGVGLGAAAIVLGLFFVGGALIWRVTAAELVVLPTLPVLKAAIAMADLGWRFWGH